MMNSTPFPMPWNDICQEILTVFEPIEAQLHELCQTPAYIQLKGNLGERVVEWQKSLGRLQTQLLRFQKDFQGFKDSKKDPVVFLLRERLENCEKVLTDFRKRLEMQGSKLLSSRTHLQWRRKLFHTLSGLLGLWMYAYSGLSEKTVIFILATYFASAVLTEVVRRVWPSTNDTICRLMASVMRERERRQISSATWYLGSMLVVFLIFSKPIGTLTLFYIAVGDPVAGIVGTKWGKHRLANHVSQEGFAASWLICFLGTLFFMGTGIDSFQLSGGVLLIFSILGGLIGAGSESLLKQWDDNLTIPLLSAPSLWLLTHLLK